MSPNMLIHSGDTAILTNLPVAVRTGANGFFLHVGFSVVSTGSVDHKIFVSASTHVNRANTNAPPELPELMSVSPYTEFPLFTDGEAYQFSDAHPFRVDYHDYDPGVDASRVKIEAGGRGGNWTDVTAHFDRRSTRASLKPGHCFDLSASNPTIRVSVPELDYPVPSVFSLTYRMIPTSNTNAPYVTHVSRHAYMCGISTIIELRGINLGLVTNLLLCERAHATNRQPLKIEHLRSATSRGRESKNLDTMTVRVSPYRTGIFCLQMNGLIQTQHPLLVLDSPDSLSRSEEELDQSLKKVPDRNGDGIISAIDLDIDGDGLPDSKAIVFPSRSIDLDGDGLPNEFDHEPLKPNTNYMRFRSGPQDLSNVVEVMRTLGHVNPSPGSKDEAGPLVIISPAAP